MATVTVGSVDVSWRCPECGTKNTDDFIATAEPFCEGCDSQFSWNVLLNSEQMVRCNQFLQELNKLNAQQEW